MRERIQQFGGFLAGMIIPNIGAFIAWGLITALFIPTGWIPNAQFGALVGPMISYLLPILIGYTGGKMVHGVRGGVVGAAATMGVVVGANIPMFLGAMIMGPLGGYLIKQVDERLEEHIPVGFEMLINNYAAGILAVILALFGNLVVGPIVQVISNVAGSIVDALVSARLLPLAALIIEPAKILFLNNAINHGVLAPLGVMEAKLTGKAIQFLLETDPGPGLGLLVAYWVAGKGMMKESAPGAIRHPVPGRHPRDLFPLRARLSHHGRGTDLRRPCGRPLVHHLGRWRGGDPFARLDLCLPGRHAEGRVHTCAHRGADRRGRLLRRGCADPACAPHARRGTRSSPGSAGSRPRAGPVLIPRPILRGGLYGDDHLNG